MIATDVPGCREVVHAGRDRPAGAGRRRRQRWPTPSQRSPPRRNCAPRYGAAARRLAVERFSADAIGRQTVELYRSLVPSDGRGRERREGSRDDRRRDRSRDRGCSRRQRRPDRAAAARVAPLCAGATQCTIVAPRADAAGRRHRGDRRRRSCVASLACLCPVAVRRRRRFAWVFAATTFIALVGAIDDIRTHRRCCRGFCCRRWPSVVVIAALPAELRVVAVAAVVDRARAAADRRRSGSSISPISWTASTG